MGLARLEIRSLGATAGGEQPSVCTPGTRRDNVTALSFGEVFDAFYTVCRVVIMIYRRRRRCCSCCCLSRVAVVRQYLPYCTYIPGTGTIVLRVRVRVHGPINPPRGACLEPIDSRPSANHRS